MNETNANAPDLDEIKSKIRKLYAKANSTDSPEEANTCFSMAQKLLLRYNLELSQIDFKTDAERRAQVQEEYHSIKGEQKRHESEWVGKLYNRIAKYAMCRVWYMGTRNSGVDYDPGDVWICGEPHNIELMKFMISQAIDKIRILEAHAWKKYDAADAPTNWMGYTEEKMKRNTFKRGFFDGAVIGLSQAMDERDREMKQAQEGEEKNMYAVMVLGTKTVDDYLQAQRDEATKQSEQRRLEYEKKEAALLAVMSPEDQKKYLKEKERLEKQHSKNSSKGGPRQKRELSGQEARHEGYKAGKSIQLNQGLGNTSTSGNID